MPPVDFKSLQDLYELMWWIRVELEEANRSDHETRMTQRWQKRYDSICNVAKVAFKHIPLIEAIENFQLDSANCADWPDDVQDMLSHYRETREDKS